MIVHTTTRLRCDRRGCTTEGDVVVPGNLTFHRRFHFDRARKHAGWGDVWSEVEGRYVHLCPDHLAQHQEAVEDRRRRREARRAKRAGHDR